MKIRLRIRNGRSRAILLEGDCDLPRSAIENKIVVHLGPTNTLGTFEWCNVDDKGTDVFELVAIERVDAG